MIEVDGLVKRYGTLTAVDNVSFAVRTGEVFGMVGPNGAGKTTTVECIEGLREPDQGTVRVLGMRPGVDHYSLAEQIGIQFQVDALPPRIRVGEVLELFASFYSSPLDWRQLLDQVGLTAKERSPFATLSGGQKQRVFIALALVNDPDLVFMDEPTTGLDPQSRRAMWEMIEDIRTRGKTVFLTTHSMEEAERLCDRVAIMDSGRIVALDTPDNLIAGLKAEIRVAFSIEGQMDTEILSDVPGVTRVEQHGDRIVVHGSGTKLLGRVVSALESSAVSFSQLRTEEPGLEDVFLALTGRRMRD
ncbi:MAG: ABC transporter ATP-binding protein [bacterium]|nr:ABC transporter ATP-binding protein [bacterium]